MNFDSMFTEGRLAWSPCASSTDLDTWLEHEIPFVGTFELGRSRILFTVVGEIDSSMRTGVWAYTTLREDPPDTFADISEMKQWVESRFENSKAIFAVTRDLRISHYSELATVESIFDGASAFLETILQADSNPRNRARARFSAHQAEVETIERELIDV